MSSVFSKKSREAEAAKRDSGFVELIKTLGFAIGLALIFRSLLFEPFHIPSGSMRSTLLEGDYIFVSKYSYGYSRFSFPLGTKMPEFSRRFFATSKPERGDIVVFRLPSNPQIDYIKRLVGMPGDKVRVRNAIVYINDKPIKREYVDDFAFKSPEGVEKRIPRYMESLESGKTYNILEEEAFGEADSTPEYLVPEGHYFFMGDNRDNSFDSRYMNHVGFVPEENLIGRAEIVMLSLDHEKSLLNGFRTSRFFKLLD